MKKKKYSMPQTQWTEFHTESMIAASEHSTLGSGSAQTAAFGRRSGDWSDESYSE